MFCSLCMVCITNAQELTSIEIHNQDDFLSFAKKMSEKQTGFNVALFTDLNLLNVLSFPVGVQDDGNCTPFYGEFHGNNHTIEGLVMDNLNNEVYQGAGLFCQIGNAIVEHLVIGETCNLTGSHVGSLSGGAFGNLTVRGFINKASINGGARLGGLLGFVEMSNSVITFEDCVNNGAVNMTVMDGGGFIGAFISSSDSVLTFTNCVNNGKMTCQNGGTSGSLGGFIGSMTGNNNTDLFFSHAINRGDLTTTSPGVGGFIGAISRLINFTITLTDTMNDGIVDSTALSGCVGGFFGGFYKGTNGIFTVENSINNKSITTVQNHIGGFLSYLRESTNVNITFSQCINNGVITGLDKGGRFAGGLVGRIDGNDNTDVLFDSCINNGDLNCKGSSVGGIIGEFSYSYVEEVRMVINNCTNNGNIYGNLAQVGGLVGYAYPGKMMIITVNNSVNNGKVVNSKGLISGLVGLIMFYSSQGPLNLTIENSVNNGDVVGETQQSCGFYCIHPHKMFSRNMSGTVHNSINRGNVNGLEAYGITNNLTSGYNIVNLGKASGTKTTYSFWGVAGTVSQFYALEDGCVSCENATLLTLGSDGVYYQANSNVRADDLLNTEVIAHEKGVMWTGGLDFTSQIKVTVGAPVGMILPRARGDTWKHIGSLFKDTIKNAIPVYARNNALLDVNTELQTDTDVALVYVVMTSGALDKMWFLFYGTRLGEITDLKPFLNNDYAIFNQNDKTFCDENTAVTDRMQLYVYWKPRVVIEIPKTDRDTINPSEVADAINKISGVSKGRFTVVVPDDEQTVTRIIIVAVDNKSANDIADAINQLEKGDECTAGILCKSKRSFVVEEMSGASTRTISKAVALTFTWIVLATIATVF